MALNLFLHREGARKQFRQNAPFWTMVPLLTALAFGCGYKGPSISGMNQAQIEKMHRKIALDGYKLHNVNIEIVERRWLCTTDCDALSSEGSNGFNSDRPVTVVYIKIDSDTSYVAYIYNKQTGKRILQGIGDSYHRTFAVVDEEGNPIRVKRARHDENGWRTPGSSTDLSYRTNEWRTERDGIVMDNHDASLAWYRAVSDFLALLAMDKP